VLQLLGDADTVKQVAAISTWDTFLPSYVNNLTVQTVVI